MATPAEKRVVITGSTEGIGHHLLRTLLDVRYRVAGFNVETDTLSALQKSFPDRLHWYKVD